VRVQSLHRIHTYCLYLDGRLGQWWEYTPTTQEGSIPAHTNICVHEHVCLYWVMYLFTKKKYTYVFIRYLEFITQAL
jgi:hypothetical protein